MCMKFSGNRSYHTVNLERPASLRQLNSNYPPVEQDQFLTSVSEMYDFLKDAEEITQKIMQSETLAKDIMEAAQVDDAEEVSILLKDMIRYSEYSVAYTPSALQIQLKPLESGSHSKLTLQYSWGV